MFVQLSSFVIKTKVVQNINRMSERQTDRQKKETGFISRFFGEKFKF